MKSQKKIIKKTTLEQYIYQQPFEKRKKTDSERFLMPSMNNLSLSVRIGKKCLGIYEKYESLVFKWDSYDPWGSI